MLLMSKLSLLWCVVKCSSSQLVSSEIVRMKTDPSQTDRWSIIVESLWRSGDIAKYKLDEDVARPDVYFLTFILLLCLRFWVNLQVAELIFKETDKKVFFYSVNIFSNIYFSGQYSTLICLQHGRRGTFHHFTPYWV